MHFPFSQNAFQFYSLFKLCRAKLSISPPCLSPTTKSTILHILCSFFIYGIVLSDMFFVYGNEDFNSSDLIKCTRCSALAHLICVYQEITTSNSANSVNYTCQSCSDPNFKFFDIQGDQSGRISDKPEANELLSASILSHRCMKEATVLCWKRAEEAAKKAADASRKANKALEFLDQLIKLPLIDEEEEGYFGEDEDNDYVDVVESDSHEEESEDDELKFNYDLNYYGNDKSDDEEEDHDNGDEETTKHEEEHGGRDHHESINAKGKINGEEMNCVNIGDAENLVDKFFSKERDFDKAQRNEQKGDDEEMDKKIIDVDDREIGEENNDRDEDGINWCGDDVSEEDEEDEDYQMESEEQSSDDDDRW